MSREQDRIKRKLEKNPVEECNKVRQKFCPELFMDFSGIKDPRHQSYIEYSNKVMLGTMFYKGIAGIESMQSMTYEFTPENVTQNILRFLGEKEKTYLPHAVTINEYFEKLAPEELQKVQQKQVYELIRRKTFDGAKFQKKWLVIVDGTQTYSGSRKLNDGCLERRFHKDTNEEMVNYHCDVLEAKIVFGENFVVSIASEFIENNGKTVKTEFQWISSLRITQKNAEKIAATGRKRWKIENEGFNRLEELAGRYYACVQLE